VGIRGNVDTRLRKLTSTNGDGLDAIVLARAGLQRLGRESEIGAVLDPRTFVPAPGQGVLALQGRAEDRRMQEAAHEITDQRALACLRAERAVARALDASCHTPLGACAVPDRAPGGSAGDGHLRLHAWVGLPDGSAWASDERVGPSSDPEALGHEVGARLKLAGASAMLKRAEQMASRA
jgi:hydroxymethylbilane synthase